MFDLFQEKIMMPDRNCDTSNIWPLIRGQYVTILLS